jgi:iron complex outermembrane receptor protein
MPSRPERHSNLAAGATRATGTLLALIACIAPAALWALSATTGLAASPPVALAEVTVTARRRAEDLQAVPAALSVIDAGRLEASGTVNLQQLSLLVPALYYNSANPRNTAYTIRGLGSNTLSISAANDGIEPGVGFYVDDVYHARPATAAFDFTDVERVEVMRGPQGTLYGKNTTAGAIHVISRPPSFEPAGDAQLSVGGFGFLQAKGSISGPLHGPVAGRLSAQLTRRDGTIRNVRSGEDLNAVGSLALRGQLLYEPDASLRLRLIADVADLDSACCTQVYLRVGQSRRSAARQFPALAAGLGYAPPSLDPYDRLSDIDTAPRIDTQESGIAAIADWRLARGTLTSVTAWRYWDWDVANDRDYTGIPIQLVQRIPSRQDQYSQELRFASARQGRFDYVAGLYAFEQRITGRPTSVYGPQAAYWLLNPASFSAAIPRDLLNGYGQTGESRFAMESYAAFGEFAWQARHALRATLGLRYAAESKRGTYSTTVSGGPALAGLPHAVAAELTRARLSILRPQSYAARDSGGSLSGRANLAWQATEGTLAYLAYAQGFKSGGLNMSGLPLDAANQPALATAIIGDERHRTLELGLKSSLLDGRVSLNLAAFRTVVSDYQANVVSSLETAALRSYPSNVPQVRVRGAEADFVAALAPGLKVRLSAAYADGRNTDYPAGPCPLELQTAATLACDLTGARLAGLSRWSGSLGIDYRRAAGPGEVFANLETAARSGYFSDASASRYTWIDGHALVNAALGYRFRSGPELELFARNLFDEDHVTALTIQTGNSGLILGQPGDPRLVGVSLRLRY